MTDRPDFYAVYPEFRRLEPPALKPKHVRQFDDEFWRPTACTAAMSVLKVGCGGGLFLAYLADKGVAEVIGLDQDATIAGILPPSLAAILRPGGRILVRVPNAASPWGLQYQFHDLTHKAAYTAGSIRQLAMAAGLECAACLPQRRRRGVRRWVEDGFHALLSRILSEPPGIWSANFLAVFAVRSPPTAAP